MFIHVQLISIVDRLVSFDILAAHSTHRTYAGLGAIRARLGRGGWRPQRRPWRKLPLHEPRAMVDNVNGTGSHKHRKESQGIIVHLRTFPHICDWFAGGQGFGIFTSAKPSGDVPPWREVARDVAVAVCCVSARRAWCEAHQLFSMFHSQ